MISILLVACSVSSVGAISPVQTPSFLEVRSDFGKGAGDKVTFQKYYESQTKGRGVWKWSTALDAYQRHFAEFIGKPLSLVEVGVQSGGSLLMWQNVFGKQVKLYGLDINPQCKKFQDTNVDIIIGDQGDWNMWTAFTQALSTGLTILVDDGSHLAPHMVTTMTAVYPHLLPGGYAAIEDIHGITYLETFFKPTAKFLAGMTSLHSLYSVHLYPTLLLARKGGLNGMKPEPLLYKTTTNVTDFGTMWAALEKAPAGSQIVLRNPAWINFFTEDALYNFFSSFNDLHAGGFKDTPTGCSTTKAAVCTNEVSPMTYVQTKVSAVHIYQDHAVIEVPAKKPRIAAVRKGTEWIGYGL
jgi:hypothetical protein